MEVKYSDTKDKVGNMNSLGPSTLVSAWLFLISMQPAIAAEGGAREGWLHLKLPGSIKISIPESWDRRDGRDRKQLDEYSDEVYEGADLTSLGSDTLRYFFSG